MVNLHTHTERCKHAVGKPADYAAYAVEKGFSVLGFSDHTPFPDNRMGQIRMDIAELDAYIAEVRAVQQAYPQLTVRLGLECEYFPELHDFYQNTLLREKKLDYLIGSVHAYPYHGRMRGFWDGSKMDREALMAYADCYIEMMRSGLFLFGAHPDTFGATIAHWNEDCAECAERICAVAEELDFPLEINTSGWWKVAHQPGMELPYPLEPFWKIAAAHHIRVVIDTDAHTPEAVDAYLEKGYALAKACGLEIIYPFGQ